jgi:hypothetical protein
LKTTQNLNGILRNNTWNIFSIYIYFNFTSNKLKIKKNKDKKRTRHAEVGPSSLTYKKLGMVHRHGALRLGLIFFYLKRIGYLLVSPLTIFGGWELPENPLSFKTQKH